MRKKGKRKLWFLCAGVSDGRLPNTEVDGLLISTASDCKNPKSILKTKEMLRIAKPKYLKLDSGGFQILSAEKNEVLR
ncbi:MAG: hypothetical protein ACOYOS_21495 [Syntrophales bacterium]